VALDHAGDVESRRIERLQDVVACGGQEAGLGDIGLVGFALGAPQFLVQASQFLGALVHAPFQGLVGLLKRLGRGHARGDIGQRGDDAAVRHGVGADFDDQTALAEPLEKWLRVRDVAHQAFGDSCLDLILVGGAAAHVEANDFVKADAHAGQRHRQVEDLAELPVPADELQILVEHRDALADVVERGLQNLAVVLDRRIGIVQELQRRLGGDRPLAQEQRQDEPR